MMGERSAQDKLFGADHIYLDYVGRDTLYGYLAQHRGQLFRDEDFAILYCRNNGRPSVPPSLAVSILFLRAYDSVSFVEAIERTKYDLRWKVALGLEMEEVPIQKSALQEFQARLVLHEQGEALLKKSIDEARRAGYVTSRKIRVALDTTPTLGKGAVKDTYNLLADGIEKLACRLAAVAGEAISSWADKQELHRYFGSSLKGEAAIDWDDKAQREQLLTQIVQDRRRLLSLAEQARQEHPDHAEAIPADAALLGRLIRQGVEETVGDCAYGGGPTRKAFADEQRLLTAKVPTSHNGECFPKSAFAIDLDRMEVRCPAGQTTTEYESQGVRRGGHFLFPDATCQACCLRSQCVRGQRGRSISIQPEERLQQQARAHNQTQAGQQSLRERVVVEHGIARLVRLGIRQSRYFGKTKTRFQVIMAAVVANLSLVVGFSHREQKPAMNTSDPEIQALSTPTDAQGGFLLAHAWICWGRLQYFLLEHVLFGLVANPASS